MASSSLSRGGEGHPTSTPRASVVSLQGRAVASADDPLETKLIHVGRGGAVAADQPGVGERR